jgi:hypothetical protein
VAQRHQRKPREHPRERVKRAGASGGMPALQLAQAAVRGAGVRHK